MSYSCVSCSHVNRIFSYNCLLYVYNSTWLLYTVVYSCIKEALDSQISVTVGAQHLWNFMTRCQRLTLIHLVVTLLSHRWHSLSVRCHSKIVWKWCSGKQSLSSCSGSWGAVVTVPTNISPPSRSYCTKCWRLNTVFTGLHTIDNLDPDRVKGVFQGCNNHVSGTGM